MSLWAVTVTLLEVTNGLVGVLIVFMTALILDVICGVVVSLLLPVLPGERARDCEPADELEFAVCGGIGLTELVVAASEGEGDGVRGRGGNLIQLSMSETGPCA